MNVRLFVCAIALSVTASAHAQFLGDAMAAAGLAEMEGDVGAGALGALTAAPDPRAGDPSLPSASTNMSAPQISRNVSIPTQSVPVTNAPPMGSPSSTPSNTPASGEPSQAATPAPDLAPMSGGTVMPGGGKIYTPEEANEWKGAFRPVGATVDNVPAGAETVTGNFGTLKYSKGCFYKQQGNRWTVVAAPVGAVVQERPAGASYVVYRNVPYLYYNGAFFVWDGAQHNAKVVAPPSGAIVTYIPDTAKKQEANGNVCFMYGGTCFKPSFRGSSMVYVVG